MTDNRARLLAQHRQRIAHEGISYLPAWDDLTNEQREQSVQEAATWLRAAVEAGIAPAAERPSDKHDAVYVDEEGLLYGEYRTDPGADYVVRLVWASEQAESMQELKDRYGAEFRLIGWSE